MAADPAQALLAAVLDRLAPLGSRSRRKNHVASWRALVEVVTANLAIAVFDPPPSGKVVMSIRSRLSPARYRNRAIGKTLPDLLRLLDAAGLAEMTLGGRRGRMATTCRPTPVFAALVALHGVSEGDIGWRRERGDTIVLTRRAKGREGGKRKPWVDYADTPETKAIRQEMATINAHLAGADLAFLGNAPGQVDTSDRWMSRRFTILPGQKQRFDQCGRLFGGFWQTLPKHQRGALRIDGERCVVLDYASMFTHIAYGQAGAEASDGDLYAVPALRDLDRRLRKTAFNVFLFTKPGMSSWPKSLFEEDLGCDDPPSFPAAWTPKKVRAAILDHHPCLAQAFNTGASPETPVAGYRLMYLESQLMVALLLRLADQGTVGLPLHDALIVPSSVAHTVQGLMEDMAFQVIGCRIPVSGS